MERKKNTKNLEVPGPSCTTNTRTITRLLKTNHAPPHFVLASYVLDADRKSPARLYLETLCAKYVNPVAVFVPYTVRRVLCQRTYYTQEDVLWVMTVLHAPTHVRCRRLFELHRKRRRRTSAVDGASTRRATGCLIFIKRAQVNKAFGVWDVRDKIRRVRVRDFRFPQDEAVRMKPFFFHRG